MDGINLLGPPVALDSTGTATFSTTKLAAGDHPAIAAIYSGDVSFIASTSPAIDQQVNLDNTTLVVTSSPNPSFSGQSITFTATVAAIALGDGTPTGTVTFIDPISPLVTYVLGPVTLDNTGKASIKTKILPASLNSETITAVYSGDASYATNSVTINQTIFRDFTTATVTSSMNPSVFGQPVTLSTTVKANAPGSGTPTGSVIFTDGAAPLGTVTLSGGKATFKTTALSVGTNAITAAYIGDPDFVPSSSLALESDGVSEHDDDRCHLIGQSLDQWSGGHVHGHRDNPGSRIRPPAGSVQFQVDGQNLGSPVVLSGGTAISPGIALTIGSHTVTVDYVNSDGIFLDSSGGLSQIVKAAPVITWANPADIAYGTVLTVHTRRVGQRDGQLPLHAAGRDGARPRQ